MFLSENVNRLGTGGGELGDISIWVDRIYLSVILLGSYCIAGWFSLRAGIKYLYSYSFPCAVPTLIVFHSSTVT